MKDPITLETYIRRIDGFIEQMKDVKETLFGCAVNGETTGILLSVVKIIDVYIKNMEILKESARWIDPKSIPINAQKL